MFKKELITLISLIFLTSLVLSAADEVDVIYVDNTHTGSNEGTLENPYQSFTALWGDSSLDQFDRDKVYIRATNVPYRQSIAGHFSNAKAFGNKFYFDWDGVNSEGRGESRAQVWGSQNADDMNGSWTRVDDSNIWYHDNLTNVDSYVGTANGSGVWWVKTWPDDVVVLRGRDPHNDINISNMSLYDYYYNSTQSRLYVNIDQDPFGEYIEYGSDLIPGTNDQTFEIYTSQEIYRGVFRFAQRINQNGHCSGWIIDGTEMSYAGQTIFETGADPFYTMDYYDRECCLGASRYPCPYSGTDGCSAQVDPAIGNETVPLELRSRMPEIKNSVLMVSPTYGILFTTAGGDFVVGGRDFKIHHSIIRHIGSNQIFLSIGNFSLNDSIYIYNNIFLDWKNANGAVYSRGADNRVNNLTIKGNIFINPNSTYPAIQGANNVNNLLERDYNLFWAIDGTLNSSNFRNSFTFDHSNSAYDEGNNSLAVNPLFLNISNVTNYFFKGSVPVVDLSQFNSSSSIIDRGYNHSFSSDFLGNPIYDLPDIGPYEYVPPFNLSSNPLEINRTAKVYSDGKYKYNDSESLGNSNVSIILTPSEGYSSSNRKVSLYQIRVSEYASDLIKFNISNISSSEGVNIKVCDLTIERNYSLSIDGVQSSNYTTDSSGCLTFDYNSGWSEHEFELSILEVSSAPVSSSSSSSGYPSYSIKPNEVEKGMTKSLGKNWKMQFKIGSRSHQILVKNISPQRVEIELSSDPITFDLHLDESKKFDLDNDMDYDIEIYLKNVTGVSYYISNNNPNYLRAEVMIKEINESYTNKEIQNNQTINQEEIETKEPKRKGTILLILFSILMIGIVYFYFFLKDAD